MRSMKSKRNKAYFVCSDQKFELKDNKFVIKNKKEEKFEPNHNHHHKEQIVISKCLYP
jgi:hypothetical protein